MDKKPVFSKRLRAQPPPKPKPGRPKVKEPRDQHLDIRLTAAEREKIDGFALAAGRKPPEWAREQLLQGWRVDARSRQTDERELVETMRKLVAELATTKELFHPISAHFSAELKKQIDAVVRQELAAYQAKHGS